MGGWTPNTMEVRVERAPSHQNVRVFLERQGRYITLRWFLWDELADADAYACSVYRALYPAERRPDQLVVEGGRVVDKG